MLAGWVALTSISDLFLPRARGAKLNVLKKVDSRQLPSDSVVPSCRITVLCDVLKSERGEVG